MILKINSKNLNEYNIKILKECLDWNIYTNIITQLEVQLDCLGIVTELLKENPNLFKVKSISWECLENLNEGELVDTFISLEEMNSKFTLVGTPKDKIEDIKKILEELYINNLHLQKCVNVIGSEIDWVDLGIMGEIFELENQGPFSLLDSALTLEVNKDGNLMIYDYSGASHKYKGLDFKEILNIENKIKMDMICFNEYKELKFSLNSYIPIVNIDLEYVEKFQEYKWLIFKYLKNLDIEEMSKLPIDMVNYCNQNNFVLYKDAIEILNKDYPFLKYYN